MSEGVFVAGATGAIGRRLCLLLVRDGWRVTGTTRCAEKTGMLRAMGVVPAVVDAYDAEGLREAVARSGAAVVIHQLTDLPPALDPAELPAALVRNARLRDEGTRHLVAAAVAAGVRRMVAQSIAFAYAPGPLPQGEDSPLNVQAPADAGGRTARGVESLEQQVLGAPLEGLVLRYGRLYGPGTGFDEACSGAPLHVDAAADAARRAATRGAPGVYNVAEEDGAVACARAACELDWNPGFRIE